MTKLFLRARAIKMERIFLFLPIFILLQVVDSGQVRMNRQFRRMSHKEEFLVCTCYVMILLNFSKIL